jgi:hypothetical protein
MVNGPSHRRLGRLLGLGRLFPAFQIRQPPLPLHRLVVLFAHISLYINSVFRLCVVTMIIRLARFNTYLLTAALVSALAGCETTGAQREKQIATLRLHVEASRDARGSSAPVPISRATQVMINVEKIPFIDEAHVAGARLVDTLGGFSLAIQFDQHGTWLLEQYSATSPGRHISIAAQFGGKLNQTRWLAAPLITRRISDGALVFTPDATHEEAAEIVRGLNNVAIKNGNQPKPNAKSKAK